MDNNTIQKAPTPEEMAIDLVEKTLGAKASPIALGDGEEIVASYDFPTASDDEKTSEIYLTTHRFVHVEKRVDKHKRTKKVNAFSIDQVDCIDTAVCNSKSISFVLVVLTALLAIASAIVGIFVTSYAYAGAGVFAVASLLLGIIPREKKTFMLLISSLSEHSNTSEVITLGAINFRDVKGDELESGDVDVADHADISKLDQIISEIGAKVVEIKERKK